MKVEIAIGEMHRFELSDALLIYRENRRSFITWHTVTPQKQGPPLLGPAQPLTTEFVEDLAVSLSGGARAEVLPKNVLAKTDRMIAWWTPRRVRRMFFENSEGKAQQLNGKLFPQPPLVWKVAHGELQIRALCENKRPNDKTTLAVAPFWNLSDDGSVCLGSMRCPESASAGSIEAWERGFYESAFTHANVGRLTRHEGGHDALWAKLEGKRRAFPTDTLIRLQQTLVQFIQGR
ncbi:MAG TPA: PRTRC system protein B [Candidatus Acidoferrales bacterium]|nr:PRTRC system protein B [Candidatus Acidoferrales bacterium]